MLAGLYLQEQKPPAVFESTITTEYSDASPFGFIWGYQNNLFGGSRGSATNTTFVGNIKLYIMEFYSSYNFCRIVFINMDDYTYPNLGFTKISIDGTEYSLTFDPAYNGFFFSSGVNLFSVSKPYDVKVFI